MRGGVGGAETNRRQATEKLHGSALRRSAAVLGGDLLDRARGARGALAERGVERLRVELGFREADGRQPVQLAPLQDHQVAGRRQVEHRLPGLGARLATEQYDLR